MKNLVKTLALSTIILMMTACASKNNQTNRNNQEPSGKRGGPPSFSQLIEEMDSNKDGKIAEIEVKGQLKNDFSKIDSNNDGYISKEEFERRSKPQRGEPQRR